MTQFADRTLLEMDQMIHTCFLEPRHVAQGDCQKELQFIFDSGFNDNTKSFVVDGKGQNIRYTDGAGKIRSQEILYKHYKNK